MRICDRLERWMPKLRHPPAEEQDYDLHDDRALPDLQTAINQAQPY